MCLPFSFFNSQSVQVSLIHELFLMIFMMSTVMMKVTDQGFQVSLIVTTFKITSKTNYPPGFIGK